MWFECVGRLCTAFTSCKSVHCMHNNQELNIAKGSSGMGVCRSCTSCLHAARVCNKYTTVNKLDRVTSRCGFSARADLICSTVCSRSLANRSFLARKLPAAATPSTSRTTSTSLNSTTAAAPKAPTASPALVSVGLDCTCMTDDQYDTEGAAGCNEHGKCCLLCTRAATWSLRIMLNHATCHVVCNTRNERQHQQIMYGVQQVAHWSPSCKIGI